MIGDPNIEYEPPLYDEDGNLIEVIEEDEIFPDDPLPFPELPDEAYEGELNDLAEQQGEEESNIDPVEEIISSAGEVYSESRNKLVELYTQILTTGEITAEQNVELEQTLFEYSSSYNEIKDKVVEQEQGNNDGVEIEQEPEPIVTDELIEEIIDRLNNGGRNDLLFVDEDGRVLVNGEQVPLLKLIRLDVEQLYADYAEIKVLVADKADINELNAVKATIGEMDVDIGRIDTLLGGNLTMENMASLILTSKKVTVEDAFIKNAMIDSISAAKINTGILNTNLVNIQSEDGSLLLNGTLQQFKDQNGKVRIQMGKDAQGNFTFGLFDSTGVGTLIDSTGIKEKAIGDGLIVDKMIGNSANISGSKLDINSVVTEVNNGTNTIKSNKILFDDKKQTLDIAFSQMDSKVTTQGQTIGTHTTQIQVAQSNIQTLISETNIIEDGNKVTVKDAYSKLNIKVNEFGVSLKDVESDFKNMVIGGRNLLFGTAFDLTNDPATIWSNYTGEVKTGGVNNQNYYHMDNSSNTAYKDMLRQIIFNSANKKIKQNSWYTLSFYVRGTVGSKLRTHVYPRTIATSIKGFVDNVETTLIGDGGYDWVMTNEWVRHTYTFYTNPENAMIESGEQAVLFRINASTVVDICMPMLEEATKVGDWSKAQEDTDGALTNMGTRVKNAESKLTLDGLTTIIGSTYITPTQLNNKGYATTSDVTQSVNAWVAKFNQSGGYNLLYNGNLKGGFKQWNNSGSNIIVNGVSCPTNSTAVKLVGILGAGKSIYQSIGSASNPLNIDTPLVISMWGCVTSAGTNGTTNPYLGYSFSIKYTDGTYTYPGGNLTEKGYDKWNRYTQVLTPTTGKKIESISFQVLLRDSTKTMYVTDIILSIGSTEVPYAGNPNEAYDGITTIDRDGIEVTATNAGTKTLMSADGFFLKNLNGTNLFKVDKDGLEMTGKITATSGQIAGFNISGSSLWNGSLGLAGPEATQSGIAIWAGHTIPERAPLKIYHSGEFISDGEYYSGGPKTKVSIKNGQINLSDSSGNAINLAPTGVGGQFTVDGHLSCMGGINAQELQLDTSLTVNGTSTFNGDAYITGKMKSDTTFIKATNGDTTRDFSVGNFGGDDIYGNTQGVAYLGNCLIIYGSYSFTGLVANEVKTATIKFRVNFAMSPYISLTGNTSVPHIVDMGASSVSSTQFNLNFRRTNTTDTTVFWMAIGQRG